MLRRLVYAEMIKILKRKSVFIFMSITIFLSIMNIIINKSDAVELDSWKESTQEQVGKLVQIQTSNKEKMKEIVDETDKKVLQIDIDSTQEQLEIMEYAINNDIPVGMVNALKFVSDNYLLVYLIVLFIIIATIHSVQDEYTFGTIKQLFIQPVSRSKILFSKYISLLTFTAIGLLLFGVLSYFLGIIFFGNGGGNIELQYISGSVVEKNILTEVTGKYVAMFFRTAAIVFIIVFFSNLFTKGLFPILLGLILWIGSKPVYNLISGVPGSRYTIFPNIDLSQYLDGGKSTLTGNTLEISFLVIVVHILFCVVLTNILIEKKEI